MNQHSEHHSQHTDDSPRPLEVALSATELVERHFRGATAGQLSQAAKLLVDEFLADPDLVMGLSIDNTLTPSGLAISALVPLLQNGYVDWLTVTGTNLYYDALLALGKPLIRSFEADPEAESCGSGVFVRSSDRKAAEASLREILSQPDFQKPMGSAELYDRLGRELRLREKDQGVEYPGLLSTAHELGVPILNPSPAEGPLGSIIAELAQVGNRLSVEVSLDLNLAAAILTTATASLERDSSGIAFWCLGGGVCANLMLGSPAHLERILGENGLKGEPFRLRMAGHADPHPAMSHGTPIPGAAQDRRARDDSGAEAGKVPNRPPRDLGISTDLSIAVPLLATFMLDRVPPRDPKRMGRRRGDLLDDLRQAQLSTTLKRPGF